MAMAMTESEKVKDIEILKSMRILFEHCESHPTCEN